jgi:riboflavin synthase
VFTGLVEDVGRLVRVERRGPSARVTIHSRLGEREPWVLGESVAVNGACLTVERILGEGFEADVSAETLDKTTIGGLRLPAKVNLERASKLGGRMGGHVVLGHVDTTALVAARVASGEASKTSFELGAAYAPFLAPKGSVCIDGVSLTVNGVEDLGAKTRFDVMLVPHTLSATTLPVLAVGDRVNVEVDVLARYVHRQLGLASRDGASATPSHEHGADDASHPDQRLLDKLRNGGWV